MNWESPPHPSIFGGNHSTYYPLPHHIEISQASYRPLGARAQRLAAQGGMM